MFRQAPFSLALSLSLVLSHVAAQTYSATYLPNTAPKTTEQGQTGTNQCGTDSSQTSMCQNSYINGIDDFCVWGPPSPGPNSVIGDTEQIEVAYCLKSGYGTRLIPDGTIKGAHFVQTPDFVQVTGYGDFTKINIPAGDSGGELDPHGADGNGNPIGGLVFSNAFGQLEQIHEWTNFMSATQFCFRACKPGPKAPMWCQHIYDVMGCDWNMPANYDIGVFESCKGDSGLPMGIYGTSTFHQGDAVTPDPHPIPSSSQCTPVPTVSNGVAINNPSNSQSSGVSSAVSSPSSVLSIVKQTASITGPSSTSNTLPSNTNAQPSNTGSNKPSPSNAAMTLVTSTWHQAAAFSITMASLAVVAGAMMVL